MVDIIPAILTNSPEELKEKIKLVGSLTTRIQVDIIDGQFADNKTIDPSVLEGEETNLLIDYQLMTKDPVDWVERCVRGMGERIIGQVEMMEDQFAFVGKVQEAGLKVGFGLDIDTPIEKIDKNLLTNLDVILVMSVKAGHGGQDFDKRCLPKIIELAEMRKKDTTPFKICVDGGITPDTIGEVVKAGADEVVVGRRLFEGDIKSNIDEYLKKANGEN